MILLKNCRFLLNSNNNFRLLSQSLPATNPGCFTVNNLAQKSLNLSSHSVLFQASSPASPNETKSNVSSFASLVRNSPLIQLGMPEGKIVVGTVVDVVQDDLYIDFGFKFNAVCRAPKLNPQSYVRGSTVKVRINDLEMSERFLGSMQDMTLLEADVTLLGLVSSPVKKEQLVEDTTESK